MKKVFTYGVEFAEQCIEEYGHITLIESNYYCSIPVDQVVLMESEGVETMRSKEFWNGFNSVARRRQN